MKLTIDAIYTILDVNMLSIKTVPACKELAMVRALLMSFVNTAAAKPYVVLFARSITSFMSLNLKMDITGPNIWNSQ